ncbi:Myb-like DNA-binding domain protein [Mortierella sp. GBA30]|nr:Myb-like DNA-binding domain protein [Mortierella sp. GBA30]
MRRYVRPAAVLLQQSKQPQQQICRALHSCSPSAFIANSFVLLAKGSSSGARFSKRTTAGSTLSPLPPPPTRSLGILHRQSTFYAGSVRFSSTLQIQDSVPNDTLSDQTSVKDPTATATATATSTSTTATTTTIRSTLKPSSPRKAQNQSADPWKRHEDELLFDLRQRGVPWKKICPILKRPLATCYARYYRFLDPFLADAVEDGEGDPDEEESIREAVETSQRNLEANVKKGLLNRSLRDKSGKPLPYHVQGPWTAADRDRLEWLVSAKTPWPTIARELHRNQESCKEKWLRIRRSRMEKKRQSKSLRTEQWKRLFKEGFSTHHRDQLVRAVERQLAAKGGSSSAINTVNPLAGFLQMDDRALEEPESEDALLSRRDESIDWDAVAVTLNKKFPAPRLKSIYRELAAAKLIWTPDEDERLTRAVIRLGPPELQPKIWTMIKDAFGDITRTSEDYRTRWRELDMPTLDREWDLSEKVKFWRRWMEYQTNPSFFTVRPTVSDGTSIVENASSTGDTETLSALDMKDNMWDQIAEGLEYRHGRDCQLYFERTTAQFPRDPELFRYLTTEVANVYLKPRKVVWPPESSRLLIATVNSFVQRNKNINWRSVIDALGGRYTMVQCQQRWIYWSQKQECPSNEEEHEREYDGPADEPSDLDTQPDTHIKPSQDSGISNTTEPRLWTDKEIEQLMKGVSKHGQQWSKIRDQFLPHRPVQMIRERYWRDHAKITGTFSEKERSLLETAIETFGEGADWGLIASHVPGRTANQCRQNWNYGRTHHVQKQDEPWTDADRELLKNAVARFGSKKWTLISEFVVGKTPDQCRMEWRTKLDPSIKTMGPWSTQELDLLMERVMTLMNKKEDEEKRRLAAVAMKNDAKEKGSLEKETASNVFVDPAPRYKGKRKVDWKEVAKGIDGRTPEQCRARFEVHRSLYRIQGDF